MNILILSISDFSGHRSAANALHQECLASGLNSENLNFFHYMPAKVVQTIDKSYYKMLESKPGMWHKLRSSQTLQSALKPFQFLFYLWSAYLFWQKHLKNNKPEVVLCTQSYPLNVMGLIKKYFPINFSLYAVITDYNFNAYWVNPQTDAYFIPAEDLGPILKNQDVKEKQIIAVGMPIRKAFSQPLNESKWQEIQAKYQLKNKSILLIMGGSLGMGPIKETIQSLLQSKFEHKANTVIVCICGSNQSLQETLQNEFKENEQVLILGYVEDIDIFMRMATCLISKPGGVTMAEAMAVLCPVLSVAPLAGQEVENEQYFLKHNAIYTAKVDHSLGEIIDQIIKNKKIITKNMKPFSFPKSSKNIVKIIQERATFL